MGDVVMEIDEVGMDVIATFSGTIDVSGLPSDGTSEFFNTRLIPVVPIVSFSSGPFDFYNMTSTFQNLGFSERTSPDSRTGDVFALADSRSGAPGVLGVASGFTSRSVSGSMTFLNTDIAGLGLCEGVFTAATANDTITLTVGDAIAAVPLPATLPLLLAGLGAVAMTRRKRG
ncbi:hypothetical protein N9W17_00110 [Jannaschia sp.]|nr:hypothetical protein [Jannaschia sp.]